MSYKKIVAGVATFAVASAMVVPAAFATGAPVNPAGDPNTDAFNYVVNPLKGGADPSKWTDEEKEYNAKQLTSLEWNEARAKEFNEKKKAALKAGKAAKEAALKMLDRSSTITVGEREYTVAGLIDIIDSYMAKVEALTPSKDAMHQIDNYGAWLKDAAASLQNFVNKVPDAKKSPVAKAEAKKAAKAGKLPKTADQAPVAPFAAVAGSAALIAAGLVASRKVNA